MNTKQTPSQYIKKMNFTANPFLLFIIIAVYIFSLLIFDLNINTASKKTLPFFNVAKTTNTNLNSNITAHVSYIKSEHFLARHVNNNKIQHYIYNETNVMKLINHSGNKNGITYKYDAYGKPLNVNNDSNAFSSEVINQFMYAGQRYDKHTKLQYLRARFFMPYLKRFATQDSISFLNKFNYANNNPTMLHDPSGHFAELINFIFNGAGLLLSLAALSVSFGCTSLFISAVSSNIFSVSNLMLSFTNNDTLHKISFYAGVASMIFGAVALTASTAGKLFKNYATHADEKAFETVNNWQTTMIDVRKNDAQIAEKEFLRLEQLNNQTQQQEFFLGEKTVRNDIELEQNIAKNDLELQAKNNAAARYIATKTQNITNGFLQLERQKELLRNKEIALLQDTEASKRELLQMESAGTIRVLQQECQSMRDVLLERQDVLLERQINARKHGWF